MNNDYLLIKDLPGHKAGCIFTIGDNITTAEG